jgi:hypothetical protein
VESEDGDEELLMTRIIEALPRLKQYHLSESQRAFIEWIERLKLKQETQALVTE